MSRSLCPSPTLLSSIHQNPLEAALADPHLSEGLGAPASNAAYYECAPVRATACQQKCSPREREREFKRDRPKGGTLRKKAGGGSPQAATTGPSRACRGDWAGPPRPPPRNKLRHTQQGIKGTVLIRASCSGGQRPAPALHKVIHEGLDRCHHNYYASAGWWGAAFGRRATAPVATAQASAPRRTRVRAQSIQRLA